MKLALPLVLSLASLPALAGEETYVFKSIEDPTFPPDPTVCAAAPFSTNVRLGASLWSVRTRWRDGEVKTRLRRIGRATACLELTNVMFPEGLEQRFYARFQLPQGAYTAIGTCKVSSNSVPEPFIVLAGCTLKIVSGPGGSLGGMVTSSSIFNPLQRPGYSTGSMWVLHEYTAAPLCRRGGGHHHDDDGEDDD
ncbi:MAG: hypothetical protein JNK82_29420 [Myxococcaceae bacterium]|nr:hypothetical protein [Myxococcaceae bacterium]